MAVATPPLRRLSAATLVAALATLTLLELPQSAPTQGESPVLQEAIDRIRSGEAEEEAEATADEPGLVPMATPCVMRRARMALGVDQAWRHGFAAATLATDPALRRSLLAELAATAPDALALWRIDVALVELALRLNETEEAAQHLARAATRPVPDSCRADEAFYAAALQDSPAEAAALLDRAVALDPGFWSAQERLAILSVKGTGTTPDACQADAVRTLQSVVHLAALARRDVQFQRLNRAVAALPTSGRSALLRGMVARQTDDRAGALTLYRQGLASLGTSECDAVLRQGLTGMIQATESQS